MTHSQHTPVHFPDAVVAAHVLLFSPSLTAQNSGRSFVRGQAGTSFDNIGSSFTAADGFGVRLTEYLDLFAEAGMMQDVCDYGFFGACFMLPIRSVITLFFEIGAARITPTLRVEQPSNLKLTATAGAHLAATRRFGFDFAYCCFGISTDRPGLAGSQVHVGIVYRF